MSGLLELAERVEAAAGPDRELDEAIQAALAGAVVEWQDHKKANAYHRDGHWVSIGPILPVTSSLDAAMTLMPEGLFPLLDWRGVHCRLRDIGGLDVEGAHGLAATPALALTAACLRARAACDSDPKA